MGESGWFRPVYILSGIWQETGWSAIIYISALSSINPDLYEAARVDGAGRFRQIWHVSLPGIRVTIVLLLILRIGNLMGSSFEKPFLMQNDLNNSVAEVLATYTYKIGLVRGSYSLSTAIGLFNSIISLILVTSANAVSKRLSDIRLF
jgi:putative aldouronate transport system permease protein